MDFNGHVLHRIRAVKDFGIVKFGRIGGWIESEANLSHEGWCFVNDEAKVFESARIYEDGMTNDSSPKKEDRETRSLFASDKSLLIYVVPRIVLCNDKFGFYAFDIAQIRFHEFFHSSDL